MAHTCLGIPHRHPYYVQQDLVAQTVLVLPTVLMGERSGSKQRTPYQSYHDVDRQWCDIAELTKLILTFN